MRILFVGDVVGRAGRTILEEGLPHLRERHGVDFVIANGENSAGGSGVSPATYRAMRRAGCDVVTGGNHSWDKREIIPFMERHDRDAATEGVEGHEFRLLRPENYPAAPGRGWCVVEVGEIRVGVLNLMGRVFMNPIDDPFRAADRVLDSAFGEAHVRVVDMHAETTSEKISMGWHLDGRVSAMIGTHTHVPTADERVLPAGTAYLTDVGMTGPYDSCIGVDKRAALDRFLYQRPVRMEPATGDPRIAAALVDVDPANGKARGIERITYPEAGAAL